MSNIAACYHSCNFITITILNLIWAMIIIIIQPDFLFAIKMLSSPRTEMWKCEIIRNLNMSLYIENRYSCPNEIIYMIRAIIIEIITELTQESIFGWSLQKYVSMWAIFKYYWYFVIELLGNITSLLFLQQCQNFNNS